MHVKTLGLVESVTLGVVFDAAMTVVLGICCDAAVQPAPTFPESRKPFSKIRRATHATPQSRTCSATRDRMLRQQRQGIVVRPSHGDHCTGWQGIPPHRLRRRFRRLDWLRRTPALLLQILIPIHAGSSGGPVPDTPCRKQTGAPNTGKPGQCLLPIH
jgi:hypothetical protein